LVQRVHDLHNECVTALFYKDHYEKIAELIPEDGTLEKLGRARTSLGYAAGALANLLRFGKKHPVITAGGGMYGIGLYKGKNPKQFAAAAQFKNKIDLQNKLKRTYGYQ